MDKITKELQKKLVDLVLVKTKLKDLLLSSTSADDMEFLDKLDSGISALINSVKEECAKEMIGRIKSLFEPKTHGTGRTTIGERKGLKLAIKAIRDSKE